MTQQAFDSPDDIKLIKKIVRDEDDDDVSWDSADFDVVDGSDGDDADVSGNVSVGPIDDS
jgi:hypothetical protein